MRRLLALFALIATASCAIPAALADSGGQQDTVTGSFVSPLPCIPTSANPARNQIDCAGSSTWLGSLSGVTLYRATTTYDLISGAGTGTIAETFDGRSADGRSGTLTFAETVTSTPTGVPDTGTLYLVADVVGGSGGFARARGSILFVGTVNGAQTSGGYHGWLELGAR